MAKKKKQADKKSKSTKKVNGKKITKPAESKVEVPKDAKTPPEKKEKDVSPELAELCKVAENGKAEFEKAKAEAEKLREKATDLEKQAKAAYRDAVGPYREACRKAGVECEFAGSRGANVSEQLRFLVEKTDAGVRVMVKNRSETEEVIPFDVLKKSVNKAAAAYTEKHLGPREVIGNKQGTVSNKLRAVLAGK